jgi:oligopeptide transport system substrate-binding protein
MFRFILLLFLCSCQQGSKAPSDTLRISFMQDPVTIDPRKISDYTSSTLVCLLFDGLARCTQGVEIELSIAEKVVVTDDEKTYTFFLKSTLWSDGTFVTAYDFEKSWKSLLTPGFPSPCAYLLYPIKNAENYALGLCEDFGVKAINEHVLQVELEKPTPYFISLTAFPLFYPAPPKPDVCNGPFMIDKIDLGSQILLKKNPLYRAQPQIDKIHISIIRDEMTAIHLFEKGELDLLGGPLTPLTIDIIPKNIPYHVIPMAASTFCTMNTAALSKEIRRSLSDAIREHPAFIQEILSIGQIPALHILPPTLRENFYQDAAKTKSIQTDPSPLILYYKNHPLEKKIAQTLQKIWKDSGFQVEIEQMESKSLMKKLHQKNYQLSLASWIAQYHDPMNILERFKDPINAKNYPGWTHPEFNGLIAHREFEKGEQLLEEEAVMIPLYHWNSPLLIHPRVHGFSSTSTGGMIFDKIFLQ